MSRFQHLEFGGSGASGTPAGPAPAKDETHFLAEARRHLERAEFETALRRYGRALEENPASSAAWAGQACMLLEMDQVAEASAWADRGLERLPDDPALLAAKARALARSGELDAALAFSDTALASGGLNADLWLARAEVLMARGDRQADYCVDQALAVAERDWLVAWQAARRRAQHRQFAAALRLVQFAIAVDAGRFVVWVLKAECEQALGQRDAARDSYVQALALEPESGAAQAGLVALRDAGWSRRVGDVWRRLRGA